MPGTGAPADVTAQGGVNTTISYSNNPLTIGALTVLGGTVQTGVANSTINDVLLVNGNITAMPADGVEPVIQAAVAVPGFQGVSSQPGIISLGTITRSVNVLGINTSSSYPDGLFVNAVIAGGPDVGLIKIGDGALYMAGQVSNSYPGLTMVNEGSIYLDKNNNFVAIAGNLQIGDGYGGASTDVVRQLNGNNQIAATATVTMNAPGVVSSSGLLDLNGFSDTVSTVIFNGGTIYTGGGTLTITSGMITAHTFVTTASIVGGSNYLTGAASSSAGSLSLNNGPFTFSVASGLAGRYGRAGHRGQHRR